MDICVHYIYHDCIYSLTCYPLNGRRHAGCNVTFHHLSYYSFKQQNRTLLYIVELSRVEIGATENNLYKL